MKHYTLPLRIEHDDRNLRVSFGDTVLLDTASTPEPDRITITLTEREAELVRHLTAKVGGSPYASYRGQADAISSALESAGFYLLPYEQPREPLDGDVMARAGCATGYAHAERITPTGGVFDNHIRLTMDPDVAVTLRHLLDCVKPTGELAEVVHKLRDREVIGSMIDGVLPRFTGVIKWKKRRLHPADLSEGRVYKLVKRHRHDPTKDEWEEA